MPAGAGQAASSRRLRRHEVAQFHGQPTPYYRSARLSPEHHHGIRARYAVPVALAAVGTYVASSRCRLPSFAAPTHSDPALMGDMQIASGFEEGPRSRRAPGSPGVRHAEGRRPQPDVVGAGRGEQQPHGNQAPVGQLGGLNMQATSSQVQQSVGLAVPGAGVRGGARADPQAGGLSVAPQQNAGAAGAGRCQLGLCAHLPVPDRAAAERGGRLGTGRVLPNTGDPIGFSRLLEATPRWLRCGWRPVAQQRRQPGDVAGEAHRPSEMLNGLRERVEENLKRVTAPCAAGKC